MQISLFKRVVATCDLSESGTRSAIFKSPLNGARPEILGIGKSDLLGFSKGQILSLSDVSESIWESVSIAQRQSGEKVTSLIVGLDDPHLFAKRVRGSSYLGQLGDGFTHDHVKEASERALQNLQPQDKQIVYNAVAAYLLDRTDSVSSPIGLYGKELSVVLQLLFSSSTYCQNVVQAVDRAGFKLRKLIPSGRAAMRSILPKHQLAGRGGVLLAQSNICHWVVFENYAIQEYRSCVISSEVLERHAEEIVQFVNNVSHGQYESVYITGEMASNPTWINFLTSKEATILEEAKLADPMVGAHERINNKSKAALSVLIGLCLLKDEEDHGGFYSAHSLSPFQSLGSKIQSFCHDYF